MAKKDIRELSGKFASLTGRDIFGPHDEIDTAEHEEYKMLVLSHGEVIGFVMADGRPFLSIKGVLKYKPEKAYVTVDMGAVKFVANGADIMAPGIVDADPAIKKDDFVWIRDVNNKRPLAVGIALVDAGGMGKGKSGKAVKSMHYVGDEIWNLSTEAKKQEKPAAAEAQEEEPEIQE